MKARLPWFVCLLTAAGLILTSAQQVKYLQLGGKLELDITPVTENITGVLWKHGPNKVTEWDKGFGPDVDYYGTYKKRTELVKATGKLVVNSMTIEDIGIYSVEVNGRVQSKTYKVEFIKDVPKPEVGVKPLSCSPASNHCTLVCDGDVKDRGPVTYRWKKDEEWMVLDSTQTLALFEITKAKEGKAKKFSCEMKNLFSEMQSEPIPNPLHEEPPPPPYWIIAVIVAIVALPFGFLTGVKLNEPMRKKVEPVKKILPKCLNDWLGFPDGPPTKEENGKRPGEDEELIPESNKNNSDPEPGKPPGTETAGDKVDEVNEVKKEVSPDSQPSAATS